MNRPILLASLCVSLLGIAVAASAAQTSKPVPPPRETPAIKRILKAMDNASTWGHPDLFGEFAGIKRLFKGDYAGAMKYFKYGARYADKLSQYSIGMMYINGRGVQRDPATGCAWLALAAQRKYPKFVEAHDYLCAGLTPAQRAQASAVLDKLLPVYGDKVAKRRMKVELEHDRTELTGSHVGHDFGVHTATALNPSGHARSGNRCDDPILYLGGVGVPSSCGKFSPALLDPGKYFAARNAQFTGTVTVGALQPDDTAAPASASSANP
ncbi:MAG TPA: sel1 repeat family protein [Rhodanobacteraceae bacterium]|nr:sel1 repeat family protein [Rhodanobacteraceae bacterium]